MEGPLQCYKICGNPTKENTFRCGPKEKIVSAVSGWLPDDVFFKVHLNKTYWKVHKGIYATKDGLSYPVVLELRSLGTRPGSNPRQCHLVFCTEVPGNVYELLAKKVTYKDRWDPEARMDDVYKGKGRRGVDVFDVYTDGEEGRGQPSDAQWVAPV